jgi:hypothetical protein
VVVVLVVVTTEAVPWCTRATGVASTTVVVVDVVGVTGGGEWSAANAAGTLRPDTMLATTSTTEWGAAMTVPTASCRAPVDRGDARPGVASRRSGATPRAIHSPRRTVGRSPPALCVLRSPPFLCGHGQLRRGFVTKLGDANTPDKSIARVPLSDIQMAGSAMSDGPWSQAAERDRAATCPSDVAVIDCGKRGKTCGFSGPFPPR